METELLRFGPKMAGSQQRQERRCAAGSWAPPFWNRNRQLQSVAEIYEAPPFPFRVSRIHQSSSPKHSPLLAILAPPPPRCTGKPGGVECGRSPPPLSSGRWGVSPPPVPVPGSSMLVTSTEGWWWAGISGFLFSPTPPPPPTGSPPASLPRRPDRRGGAASGRRATHGPRGLPPHRPLRLRCPAGRGGGGAAAGRPGGPR